MHARTWVFGFWFLVFLGGCLFLGGGGAGCRISNKRYRAEYPPIVTSCLPFLPLSSWDIWSADHSPPAGTKSHLSTRLSTRGPESDNVAIFEELASVHAIQQDVLAAALTHLKKTAVLGRGCAADGARRKHVSGPHGTAAQSVVRQHLGEGPNEVLGRDTGYGGGVTLGCFLLWSAHRRFNHFRVQDMTHLSGRSHNAHHIHFRPSFPAGRVAPPAWPRARYFCS